MVAKRTGQIGACLVLVQDRGDATFHTFLSKLQGLTLGLHVLPDKPQSLLQCSQVDIVQGDIAQQNHHHISIGFDRASQVGIGRLDLSRYPTEEVRLPTDVPAKRPNGKGPQEETGKASQIPVRSRSVASLASSRFRQ